MRRFFLKMTVMVSMTSCADITEGEKEAYAFSGDGDLLLAEEGSFSWKDKIKSKLIADEAKTNWDRVWTLKEQYKDRIKASCDFFSVKESFQEQVNPIVSDSNLSREEKKNKMKALKESMQEEFTSEKENRMGCFIEQSQEVGPLLIKKKALKYYCDTPRKKFRHHMMWKSSKGGRFKKKGWGGAGDKANFQEKYHTKIAEKLEEKLVSPMCKGFLEEELP